MYRDAYDEVREWGQKVRLRDRLRAQRETAVAERAAARIEQIDAELAGLADVDARFTEALVGKTARILAGDDEVATRVRALAEDVARAADRLGELDAAIAAGRWAQRHLARTQEAIAALDDAEAAAKSSRLKTIFTPRSKRIPNARRLGESLEQSQVWVERYVAELRNIPDWESSGEAIEPHGPRLARYVALFSGRSQALGQRARQAIAAARTAVDDTQAALESARPQEARRHADARARYRSAIENA